MSSSEVDALTALASECETWASVERCCDEKGRAIARFTVPAGSTPGGRIFVRDASRRDGVWVVSKTNGAGSLLPLDAETAEQALLATAGIIGSEIARRARKLFARHYRWSSWADWLRYEDSNEPSDLIRTAGAIRLFLRAFGFDTNNVAYAGLWIREMDRFEITIPERFDMSRRSPQQLRVAIFEERKLANTLRRQAWQRAGLDGPYPQPGGWLSGSPKE